MSSHTTPHRRLELFVRSLGGGGQPRRAAAVLERLDRLVEAGEVSDYAVHVVGRSIRPEVAHGTVPGRFICERVASFRDWAARSGVSIEPFIETRHVRSQMTDDEYETITFPTVVLAELEDDLVRAVAPCTDGDQVYAVEDLLEALAADAGPPYPGGPRPSSSASADASEPVLDRDPTVEAETGESSSR